MDKPGTEQSEGKEQAAKPSGATSSVLSILKRFRSRREAAEEAQPFDQRIGAQSGALREKVSEISSRIEASRAKGDAASKPDGVGALKHAADGSKHRKEARKDTDLSGGPPEDTSRQDGPANPRARAMGFHNPVFQTGQPSGEMDPDFKASTEPPPFKIFDVPDGVMENSGAPEKQVTAPKQKVAEPFDLKEFAKQFATSSPMQDAEKSDPTVTETVARATDLETAGIAPPFHVPKASTATPFVTFPSFSLPQSAPQPANTPKLRMPDTSSLSALQSWRKMQSKNQADIATAAQDAPPEAAQAEAAPLEAAPLEVAPPDVTPSEVVPPEMASPEVAPPEVASPGIAPDIEDPAAERASPAQDVVPSLTEPHPPHTEVPTHTPEASTPEPPPEPTPPETEEEFAPVASGFATYPAADPLYEDTYLEPGSEPSPDVFQMAEPETPAAEYESELLADFATDDAPDPNPMTAPIQEPAQDMTDAPQDKPDNIFAALDLDEDEIMLKVYDLIQAELQAAWGENITLNIRKMVRDEVRAAVLKARSEL